MEFWQRIVILVYAAINLLVFIKGFYEAKYKKRASYLIRRLFFLGIFAWGDVVIFAPFWILASLVTLVLNDWYLFLLILSVFWAVRSLGETIYWLNQQFSTINRNPPENLLGYSIFHNDSLWFVHQIAWQCVTVVSIIFSIYFARLWLQSW